MGRRNWGPDARAYLSGEQVEAEQPGTITAILFARRPLERATEFAVYRSQARPTSASRRHSRSLPSRVAFAVPDEGTRRALTIFNARRVPEEGTANARAFAGYGTERLRHPNSDSGRLSASLACASGSGGRVLATSSVSVHYVTSNSPFSSFNFGGLMFRVSGRGAGAGSAEGEPGYSSEGAVPVSGGASGLGWCRGWVCWEAVGGGGS